jgi:hypothetical protein
MVPHVCGKKQYAGRTVQARQGITASDYKNPKYLTTEMTAIASDLDATAPFQAALRMIPIRFLLLQGR